MIDHKDSERTCNPDRSNDPEFQESLPSSTSSSIFMLDTSSRSQSYQYAQPPSPLHFYHLNSPNPSTAYFMPSSLPSHSNLNPKPRRRRRCGFFPTFCCCCCSLCSVFITASTLLGLTALMTWLILRPIHEPRCFVENVEFRTLNVTAPSFGLTADVVFTLTAENSNKRLDFKYDSIGIECSYRGHVFGHSQVAKFSLRHGNATKLESKFAVEDYVFTPATLGEMLATDVKGARVGIHVRASAKVRVKVGVVTSFAVKVFVDCEVAVKPPQGTDPSSVIEKTCKLTR